MPAEHAAPQPDALPPEVLERACALVKRFYSSCFWFWRLDATVENRDDVLLVVEHLRASGGREGWEEARNLSKCL